MLERSLYIRVWKGLKWKNHTLLILLRFVLPSTYLEAEFLWASKVEVTNQILIILFENEFISQTGFQPFVIWVSISNVYVEFWLASEGRIEFAAETRFACMHTFMYRMPTKRRIELATKSRFACLHPFKAYAQTRFLLHHESRPAIHL